jgi:UDP-glucose 4-epimerase
MSKRIFVTGAAGFIGSHVVDNLLKRGYSVVGFDNLSTGQRQFLSEALLNPGFKFVEGDLLNADDIRSSIADSDSVVHLAANADIRGGLALPRRDLEQNTIATLNLLESMRLSGVKHIIFASSAAALGEPKVFPTPESCSIPDQTSLYGASKMACEGLISSYCHGYGFEGYVYRFVSILGPRYPHGHVFDFMRKLRQDSSKLEILGDGNQRKSYLHINDCINAVYRTGFEMRTARSKPVAYDVYNLGAPEYCRVCDSARWICDTLGFNPTFRFTGGERGWVGDNPFVFLDVSKVMATGWKPLYSIRESVIDTVRWLNSNPWIFETRS